MHSGARAIHVASHLRNLERQARGRGRFRTKIKAAPIPKMDMNFTPLPIYKRVINMTKNFMRRFQGGRSRS